MITVAPEIAFRHMGLGCIDVARMAAFYTSVLGMVISDQGSVDFGERHDIVFLTADPAEHHQLVLVGGRDRANHDNSPVSGGVVGPQLFQMSFAVRDLDALRRVVQRIEHANVAPITPMNHANAWSVYSRDPEGNPIECYTRSPWYAPQPCALPLDLSHSNAEIVAATRAYCEAAGPLQTSDDWSDALADTIWRHHHTLVATPLLKE
jgi:catechol 2,3-dioxygenase